MNQNHHVQSTSVSRDKKAIYLGDRLRAAIEGRKETLTTAVNLIADRYLGMIERAGRTPMRSFHAELYCNVLKEVGHPLGAREIAAFPAMVEDWLSRHPQFPQEPGKTALMIVQNSSYADLVALVDQMEKLP